MSSVWSVDDEPEMRKVVAEVLSRAGYRVATFESGRALLHAVGVGTEPPDLLLLDLLMPPPDGYAVLGTLRGLPRWRHVPVLLLSGLGTSVADVLEPTHRDLLGIAEVLTKPVLNADLLAAVARALSTEGGTR